MKKLKKLILKYQYLMAFASLLGMSPLVTFVSDTASIPIDQVFAVGGFIITVFGIFTRKLLKTTVKLLIIAVGMFLFMQGIMLYLV